MKYNEENKEAWKKIIEKRPRNLAYPHERIVALLAYHFPDYDANGAKKALDIGCGTGRHIHLLTNYGFNVYGLDYNETEINTCREMFKGNEKVKYLETKSIFDYEEEKSFDLVLCCGCIFLGTKEESLAMLKKIGALLKKGGMTFVDFRTKYNTFYGKGERIQGDTYRLGKESGPYDGCIYTFFDMEEVEEMAAECGLEIVQRERYDLWKDNLAVQHSWWLSTMRKPC